MNPQALIDALSEQRNNALNEAAAAKAQLSQAVAHIQHLEEQLAELEVEKAEPEKEEVEVKD